MIDLENLIEIHGNLKGVAYRYQKVVVYFKDETYFTFEMWN